MTEIPALKHKGDGKISSMCPKERKNTKDMKTGTQAIGTLVCTQCVKRGHSAQIGHVPREFVL